MRTCHSFHSCRRRQRTISVSDTETIYGLGNKYQTFPNFHSTRRSRNKPFLYLQAVKQVIFFHKIDYRVCKFLILKSRFCVPITFIGGKPIESDDKLSKCYLWKLQRTAKFSQFWRLDLANLFFLHTLKVPWEEVMAKSIPIPYSDEPAVVYLSRVGSRPTLKNNLRCKGLFPFEAKGKKNHNFKSAMVCTYQIELFDVPRCKAVSVHTELGLGRGC